MRKQAWLVAVGSGDAPLPNAWVTERPELLDHWPMGAKTQSGINNGDPLLYFAAHHQALIAVVRSTESGDHALDNTLRVQSFKVAVPGDQRGAGCLPLLLRGAHGRAPPGALDCRLVRAVVLLLRRKHRRNRIAAVVS